MQSAADQREKRKKRIAAGMCSRCSRPPRPGFLMCQQCSDQQNTMARNARIAAKANEPPPQCLDCAELPFEGKRRCKEHLRQRKNEYRRRQYWKRRDAGFCPRCMKVRSPEGYTYCVDCQSYIEEKNKVKREKYKLVGLCVVCGAHPPAEGITSCRDCRNKNSMAGKRNLRKLKSQSHTKGALVCPQVR